jgi:hypothetical protein
MGLSSSLISIGGALSGMFGGGGASSVQLPPMYNFQNMPGADSGAYSGIQNLGPYTNMASSAMPFAQSTFGNLYNNPFSTPLQSGGGVAGALGQNAGLNAYGAGGNLMPYAQSLLTTGFDPQQALYSRTAQQTTDQTRAGLEARGIDNTPYGAGVEGQTMANFNIDWQNAQLQRQLQAGQGASGLYGAGQTLQNQGVQEYLQASAYPYATYAQIGQGQNQALSSLLGLGQNAQGIANVPIQDYLGYLGAGTSQQGANNQTAQLALNQQNQAFNQNMQYGRALGAGLYGLGNTTGYGFNGSAPGTGYMPGYGTYPMFA